MKTRRFLGVAAAALTCFAAASSQAAVNVLNFAGLDGDGQEQVLEYYNGGAGGLGSTGGTNYGVSFGADALACSGQPGGSCNTALIPGGAGANALFFLTGPGDLMNVAAGFTTGFSFFYSAAFDPGIVTVWSGLNGTGTLLATLDLAVTGDGSGTAGCESTNFCPYTAAGVTFAGTAMSVNFSGTANQIGFADITLGSADAGGVTDVPEPSGVMLMLAGVGALGAVSRRRARQSA
ncbi:MAG: PEP-CTERM sorting domain-containing protein [Betaproteobacteria bacterium]